MRLSIKEIEEWTFDIENDNLYFKFNYLSAQTKYNWGFNMNENNYVKYNYSAFNRWIWCGLKPILFIDVYTVNVAYDFVIQ